MISKREEEILKLIVEDYIENARPVSSKSLCDALNCSSATIRAEMNYLEEVGLLEKTHISSGRVPSEEGYRYYVDNIMEKKELSSEDMYKLQTIVDNKQLALNDIILKSMEIISELTHYTTIVLGKKSSDNLVEKIEVIEKNWLSAIQGAEHKSGQSLGHLFCVRDEKTGEEIERYYD
jgi:heat-inducible transcriptional repressor